LRGRQFIDPSFGRPYRSRRCLRAARTIANAPLLDEPCSKQVHDEGREAPGKGGPHAHAHCLREWRVWRRCSTSMAIPVTRMRVSGAPATIDQTTTSPMLPPALAGHKASVLHRCVC
jgi:hypothetical protein